MITERACQAVLAHLEQDIEGFIAAAFVDVSTGTALAAHCVQPTYSLEAMSNIAKVLMQLHSPGQSGPGDRGDLEEVFVTVGDRIDLYWYVAPTVCLCVSSCRADTNVALLRSVVRARTDAVRPRAATAA